MHRQRNGTARRWDGADTANSIKHSTGAHRQFHTGGSPTPPQTERLAAADPSFPVSSSSADAHANQFDHTVPGFCSTICDTGSVATCRGEVIVSYATTIRPSAYRRVRSAADNFWWWQDHAEFRRWWATHRTSARSSFPEEVVPYRPGSPIRGAALEALDHWRRNWSRYQEDGSWMTRTI